MEATLDISNDGHYGLNTVLKQLTSYLDDLKVQRAKNKVRKAAESLELEKRIFMENLFYDPKAQKSFFDWIDNLISQKGQEMIGTASKEEAMEFCDRIEENTLDKLIEVSDNGYGQKDFEILESFFAYNSALALINTILNLYEEMKEVALEDESPDFLTFIECQIEDSLKKSQKRSSIDSISDFLQDL